MRLPKLAIGDTLYATRHGVSMGTVEITDIDRDTFYASWPDGRLEGVSRRQLREHGYACGGRLVEFRVSPSDAPHTSVGIIETSEGGRPALVILNGGLH